MEKIEKKVGFDTYTFEPNAEFKGYSFHRLVRRKGGKWEKQQQITIPLDDEEDVAAFLGEVVGMLQGGFALEQVTSEATEEELSGPWDEEGDIPL